MLNGCYFVGPLSQALHLIDRLEVANELARWEEACFSKAKQRSARHIISWMDVSDKGVLCVISDGQILGCVDVWELDSVTYLNIRKGLCDESEIDRNSLIKPRQLGSGCWYIGDVILKPELRRNNPSESLHVFRLLCAQLSSFFHTVNLPARVIAVASTQNGTRLGRLWKFDRVDHSNSDLETSALFELIISNSNQANHFAFF